MMILLNNKTLGKTVEMPNKKECINFVMSSYTQSNIYNHIIEYFRFYSKFKIIQTLSAVENANLYYYFRPHLEEKLKKNSIVTVHHDLNDTDDNLNIEKFLCRYREAKLIVCLNSKQKTILSNYAIHHTIIIPHGYNELILKPKKKSIEKKKIVLGFFSHYYPRLVKGEDYLLELCKYILPEDFSFILVGKKRNILGNDLEKLGFDCKVYEHLPYCAFNILYEKIDCLLITSKFEGGPASLPEALATNTKVLMTNVGMADEFNNNVTFFSGNAMQDSALINSLKNQKNIIMDKPENLKTWKEVVGLYDDEFMKFLDKSQDYAFFDKNIFFSIIDFKFKTLYIKKKTINKYRELYNYINLLFSTNRL